MQNYSGEEGLQYHLQIRGGDVGRYVILPGEPKRCEKIATRFIITAHPGVRGESDFSSVGNQEENAAGLENPMVHDTKSARKTAVEAIQLLS